MSLRGAVGGDRLQGGSAAKHEAKALGVIIKNQNVLHVPALGRICRWQVYRLLNDENSFRPRARLRPRERTRNELDERSSAGGLRRGVLNILAR